MTSSFQVDGYPLPALRTERITTGEEQEFFLPDSLAEFHESFVNTMNGQGQENTIVLSDKSSTVEAGGKNDEQAADTAAERLRITAHARELGNAFKSARDVYRGDGSTGGKNLEGLKKYVQENKLNLDGDTFYKEWDRSKKVHGGKKYRTRSLSDFLSGIHNQRERQSAFTNLLK